MAKRFDTLREIARVELCGAFPETLLNACALNAIEFWDMEVIDAYTLQMSVYAARMEELRTQGERCMCDIRLVSHSGGKSKLRFMLKRRWLFIFALLFTLLMALSSLFIWDIDIYGNSTLSRGEILRALKESGVSSGTYWPEISGDTVKTKMTKLLPELAWMSVNVSGSRAEILICEREKKPEIYDEKKAADVIATKTGIIAKMSVMNGAPKTAAGQAVLRGEVLVSGRMDSLSGEERFVRAKAEIWANTWYELRSVCPSTILEKTDVKKRRSRFAVKIGETRINIFISGRNDDECCDKIIRETKLGIDGLFSLPFSLIREDCTYYECEERPAVRREEMFARLYADLENETEGRVLQHSFNATEMNGVIYAVMKAHCLENIALTREIGS